MDRKNGSKRGKRDKKFWGSSVLDTYVHEFEFLQRLHCVLIHLINVYNTKVPYL